MESPFFFIAWGNNTFYFLFAFSMMFYNTSIVLAVFPSCSRRLVEATSPQSAFYVLRRYEEGSRHSRENDLFSDHFHKKPYLFSQDLRGEIEKVADFLGQSPSKKQLEKITYHLRFDNFKNNDSVNNELGKRTGFMNKDGHFMRKGTFHLAVKWRSLTLAFRIRLCKNSMHLVISAEVKVLSL